jgi:hypothetical protein
MNFQVARIRLAAVGPEPARFDPLEIDLRRDDQTGPADSVLFLPNTGGKTVLMRLLFSVLHPPVVERIGAEESAQRSKNLLGYVLDHDTSHVAIEWRRVHEGRFADDEALVIGLVAEWRGGRPTGKPQDLTRVWYSIRGPLELASVDRLNFEIDVASDGGPVRRRLPLRRFREQLEELRKSAARSKVEVSTTDVQRDWVEHLDRLGLDSALFRYQGEMNRNEAGASAIARFKQDRDFIEFFLNAVLDPAELDSLDREFDEVAEKVRRFPEYERRMQFEKAALTELEPLVDLIAGLGAARGESAEARTAALTLLAAFNGAEQAARSRLHDARERSVHHDADARRLTAEADRLRDHSREYRRQAAVLGRDEAEAAYKAASERVARADLDVRAWALTEELARYREAVAEVKALDEAWTAELERLRPLQRARDEAAARLAAHLSAQAVLAGSKVAAAKTRAAAARRRAVEARQYEVDARVEAGRLDANRQALEARLIQVAELRSRIVAKGLLAPDERTDRARDREKERALLAERRLDAIENEVNGLEIERARLDEEDRVATPRVADVSDAHSRLDADIRRAEAERRQLALHPLVIELAEAADFELELVGPALVDRLLGRAKQADDERVRIELQGADDRRAARALDDSGYLPPPAEIEIALARLHDAGIIGAQPGTRYIAEAIGKTRRDAVAANRADLAGGIVLTDPTDLPRAQTVLEGASLGPSMIIAVGTGEELAAAEHASAHRAFIVPPSDAVWDRAAAAAERERRRKRLDDLEHSRAVLQDRAVAARNLAEALSRHCATYPAGWLSMRTAERQHVSAELQRLTREGEARARRRAAITETVVGLRREAPGLRKTVQEADRRASDLDHLLEQETAVAGIGAEIERLRTEAASWRTEATDAAQKAADSYDEAERESAAALDHGRTVERINEELSKIVLAESASEPSLEEAKTLLERGDDLFELRARFDELDKRLHGETSASVVRGEREAAIKARNKLDESIATHPAEIRERAAILLASPDGGVLAGRRAAAERANTEARQARSAEQEAYSERDKANAELDALLDEIKSSKRAARIPEDQLPRDRHRAALLAADARQRAEETRRQATTAEEARDAALGDATTAERFAEGLVPLGTQLSMGLQLRDGVTLPDVAPFDGDYERAKAAGLGTAARLHSAIDSEHRAEQAWRNQDNAVRALLVRDEFSDLAATDRLHRRLSQSSPEALARDVSELVTDLRTSIRVLEGELTTLEQDRRLATTSLAKSVQKALGNLRLAETRSKMPANLRSWSGEPFLEVRFEKLPAEELDVRLRTFVTEVLNPTSDRPTGTMLLMRALDRAVGQFRVRILKPNESFAPIRVPVAELSSPTFSNGQRATVATALMLMLSELRRQSRSAARGASVGTLVLDNPLGNANAGFLIDVQRTVAAAAGIQLLYMTGIADHNALRRFTNVIALSNDSARRTMRRYVRANPMLLERLVPAQDGPGGRVSARRVVAVAEREPRTT